MAPERPRIVHLITRLELGGAQQNTLFCMRHHDRARFDVELWAGEGGLLDDDARSIVDAEIKILPWLVHAIDPIRDCTALARLASMLVDVDLLHTHSSKAGVLGRAAARLARVRGVVHTVHGWSFNDQQARGTRRVYVELERACARWTDRIVCVAAADRDRGLTLGIGEAGQYRILRSGIDPALYKASAGARERTRAALGVAPADIVVGSIANLKPQKAPLDFVEAARLAFARDARLRFFIAGDGEMREAVEQAVANAGLNGIVRILGWRTDVAELLAAMDIFLLTSIFEGLPRTVLQSLAAEVPVVVTDTGGTSEVVIDGDGGYLVPPRVPAAAAAAVVRLANDPAIRLRFASRGLTRLGVEFDIRRMVPDLERLYDDVLGTPRRAEHDATQLSHLGGAATRH